MTYKRITLEVQGMHCEGCANSVVGSLRLLNGVKRVEANFKTGTMKIEFDKAQIDNDRIKDVIIKEGYIVK